MPDFPLPQAAGPGTGAAAPAPFGSGGARSSDGAFGKLVGGTDREGPGENEARTTAAPSDDSAADADPGVNLPAAQDPADPAPPAEVGAMIGAAPEPARSSEPQAPSHWPPVTGAGDRRGVGTEDGPLSREVAVSAANGLLVDEPTGNAPPQIPDEEAAAPDNRRGLTMSARPTAAAGADADGDRLAEADIPKRRPWGDAAIARESGVEHRATAIATRQSVGATPPESWQPENRSEGSKAAAGDRSFAERTAPTRGAAGPPRQDALLMGRLREVGACVVVPEEAPSGSAVTPAPVVRPGSNGSAPRLAIAPAVRVGPGGVGFGAVQDGVRLGPRLDLDADAVGAAPGQAVHATATAPAPMAAPHLAQQVARQMALSVHPLPGGPVEIRLSPEELGRVRLTVSVHDGAIAVAVQADRPETADLMRRNIDALAREFRELGYEQSSFSFHHQGNRDRADQPAASRAKRDGPVFAGEVPPATPAPRPAASGLDLRL